MWQQAGQTLFGSPQVPQGGVMGEQQIQAMHNPKIAMAAQLLAGSAPGSQFGDVLGRALLAGQQARQQAQQAIQQQREAEQMQQYRQAQIERMQQPPAESVPTEFALWERAKENPEFASWLEKNAAAGGSGVQSAHMLGNGNIAYMTRDGRLIDTGQKGKEQLQFTNIAGVPGITNLGAGTYTPLSSAEAEDNARLRGAQAGAEGAGRGQRVTSTIDNGIAAADAISITRRGLDLLKETRTGGINAVALKASNLFGVTGADEGELSANLGKAVLSQLRSTFGAQFTEREGARLAEIEAGFGKSTEANVRLLEQAEKLLDRAARRGLAAAEESGDTFSAKEIKRALGFSLTPGKTGAPAAAIEYLNQNPGSIEAFVQKYGYRPDGY